MSAAAFSWEEPTEIAAVESVDFAEPEEPSAALAIFSYPWGEQTDWGTPPACRPGSTANKGACEPDWICPSNFKRNSTTGWCDPVDSYVATYCGKDAHYDTQLGKCVENACKLPFVWSIAKQRCVHQLSGQPCCPGQDPSVPCLDIDFVWDDSGACVSRDLPHCKDIYGPLAFYDGTLGKCACPEGYERRESPAGCYPLEPPPAPPESSGFGTGLVVMLTVGVAAAVFLRWRATTGAA